MVGSALASKLRTFAKREILPLPEHMRMTVPQERKKKVRRKNHWISKGKKGEGG
jgi:hypothetical protein